MNLYYEIGEHHLNAHGILADLLSVFMMGTDAPTAFAVLVREQRLCALACYANLRL